MDGEIGAKCCVITNSMIEEGTVADGVTVDARPTFVQDLAWPKISHIGTSSKSKVRLSENTKAGHLTPSAAAMLLSQL